MAMRFKVGGEWFDLSREQVIAAMRGASMEPIQKHVVEIEGHVFPPKQVFASVTGRTRQSFTTMEAQRVLSRLGFLCRPAAEVQGASASTDIAEQTRGVSTEDRITALEAAVGTLQAAVAGLHRRLA
jgi:hypothetical protein